MQRTEWGGSDGPRQWRKLYHEFFGSSSTVPLVWRETKGSKGGVDTLRRDPELSLNPSSAPARSCLAVHARSMATRRSTTWTALLRTLGGRSSSRRSRPPSGPTIRSTRTICTRGTSGYSNAATNCGHGSKQIPSTTTRRSPAGGCGGSPAGSAPAGAQARARGSLSMASSSTLATTGKGVNRKRV